MLNLKSYNNWVVWKDKHQPTSALTGSVKGWNKNLSSYVEATEYCERNPGYRLGFYFSADCPAFGLDIDGCSSGANSAIENWAYTFLDLYSPETSLINRSVSGTGIKVITAAKVPIKRGCMKFPDAPQHGDHTPQVELFTESKYFALTVDHLTDPQALIPYMSPTRIDRLNDLLDWDLLEQTKPTEPSRNSGGDVDCETLGEYLSKIDVMEYQSRDDWIKMLAAAHHATGGSEGGLAVFKEWSSGDEEKYDENDCESDWRSMQSDVEGGITVATIVGAMPPSERPRLGPSDDFPEISPPAAGAGASGLQPEAGGVAVEVQAGPAQASTGLVFGLLSSDNRNHAYVASRFAEDHHNILRYHSSWGKWCWYDGTKWNLDTTGIGAQRLLLDFLTVLKTRIPHDESRVEDAKEALKWVANLGNYGGTFGVMQQAKSQRAFILTHEDTVIKPHLLNLGNGTFNLKTRKLQDHDPADFIFNICEFNYEDSQSCPTWDRVIRDVFANDEELIKWFQKFMGYAVSGEPKMEIFPVAYGEGCNGKSTIVQTVLKLLGDYGATIPSEMFDSKKELHPTYVAQLLGSRFAAVAELESDVTLSESMVKKITSQDAIEARRMREDPWTFKPSHVTFLCTNHKPRVKGSDRGIWRRLKLIPFTVDLTDVRDTSIPEQLEGEYSGILNWLIAGHHLYTIEGLEDCSAVAAATHEYQMSEDTFLPFVEEFCEQGDFQVRTSEAFETYTRQGGRLGKYKFNEAMVKHGFTRSRRVVDGARVWVFSGVRMVGG